MKAVTGTISRKYGRVSVWPRNFTAKNIPDAPEPYRYVGLVDFINENIDNLGMKEIVNGRS